MFKSEKVYDDGLFRYKDINIAVLLRIPEILHIQKTKFIFSTTYTLIATIL